MYNLVKMAETARIKSSRKNWRAWGIIISGLTRQKNLNLCGGWSLTWTIELLNNFWIFYNLVNLFTTQNRLKLGPQIPTYEIKKSYSRISVLLLPVATVLLWYWNICGLLKASTETPSSGSNCPCLPKSIIPDRVVVNSRNGKKEKAYFSSSIGRGYPLSLYVDRYWWGE